MKGNKIDLRNIAWYLFLGLIISEIIIKVRVDYSSYLQLNLYFKE